ncbi:apoptosis-inducing factor 2 [Acrasis kona]|uniref:Apoptosis-inducing factor 2 n=1 Tax=Acrasis kona TaxID=1008807 RepID=A0AAW2YHQ5_9EUKA
MSQQNSTKVVVVGGGLAGTFFAASLMRRVSKKHHLEVTIIDKKDFFEVVGYGTIRSLVSPTYHSNMTHTYSSIASNDHKLVVLSNKKTTNFDLNGKNVTISDITSGESDTIVFDYLVIAVGSSYSSFPNLRPAEGVLADRRANLEKINKDIQGAKHVTIVGGGSVGIELMGELNDHFPSVPVTLIHGKSQLLERTSKDAHSYILNWVEKVNKKRPEASKITILVDDRIDAGSNVTTKGVTLPADTLRFNCTGPKPNTAGFEAFGIPLDESGRIRVDEHLRVEGHTNVLALGDANNVVEEKISNFARLHAKVAAVNISNEVQGKNTQPLKHVPQEYQSVIMLGKSDAIMVQGNSLKGKGKMFAWMKPKIESSIIGVAKNPNAFMSKMFV